ncbi:brain acid soluble protein 1-like [Chenopodium quinoa]|uniref:brain acid soluble protein 1-like n=1 Tax=Chenopodium quinoa TaxID=63459 RepID=UPI000B77E46B|nr:brain acid soluble protein 1-like [Chenopodium quinoa]
MARTRWTEVDPDYKSDDVVVDPAVPLNEEQTAEPSERVPNEDTPQDSPGVPSTPGDSILGSSGSNVEESSEGSGEGSDDEESGSDEESSEKAAPIDEEAYKWPAKGDPTDMTMSATEVAKGMVPPKKTPATSALLLRKKQIEEKKVALAAKNAGAGSQVIPRSLASMHKRPAGNIPQSASKAPKVATPAASSSRKTPDKDRPTTARKSLQSIPHFEMAVEEIRQAVRT